MRNKGLQIEDVTEALNDLKTDADDTVIEEGLIVGQAEVTNKADNMPNPPVVVDFEDENDQDEPRALQESCQALSKIQWDDSDVNFFFAQAEIKMSSNGAKKQFTKFQVLSSIIPRRS